MTLSNIKLKRSFLILFSISYWGLFAFSTICAIKAAIDVSTKPNDGIAGYIIGMSFISLIIVFIFFLVSGAIAFLPTRDSENHWLVTSGMKLIRRKYKFVSHSELGYFILIFDGSDADLYEVNWVSLKYIINIDMNNYKYDPVKISNRIKSQLDDLYRIRLEEIRKKEDIKNNINKLVTKWDGHLDVVSRRDSKIDQILK